MIIRSISNNGKGGTIITVSFFTELPKIVYDERARNGVWCKAPYPGHPRGCFKFPNCPQGHKDFMDFLIDPVWKKSRWFAVVEEFDLGAWARRWRRDHPNDSDRQCRNPLYWQGKVRARLKRRAYCWAGTGDVVLEVPEASGINVFETLRRVDVVLERHHPEIVRKVMLVGKKGKEPDD